MAKNLVIVESPAKAKTIKRYLGSDFQVIPSVGHVDGSAQEHPRRRCRARFQARVPRHRGQGEGHRGNQEAGQEGKDHIYLATDPDREGEAIAWHIADQLGRTQGQRSVACCSTRSRRARCARRSPIRTELNHDLFDAQQARRVLDRLVGYQISPLLWDKVKRGISAGRVQSVALRIIVEREKEREAFRAEEYWTLDARLEAGNPPPFKARLYSHATSVSITRPTSCPRPRRARSSRPASRSRSSSARIERKEVRRSADAAVHHLAPAAGGLAQALLLALAHDEDCAAPLRGRRAGRPGRGRPYHLYAHRLGAGLRPGAELPYASYIVESLRQATISPSRPILYRSSKSAQDAHEAIRPTAVERDPESMARYLGKDELALYTLIFNRFVSSQMNPAVYDRTTVDIEATEAVFRATGQVIKFDGFMRVYIEGQDDAAADDDEAATLPAMTEGETLKLLGFEPEQHFTQPPPRFSQATLIKELEDKGIGRPSTYAAIMTSILNREYVEEDESKRLRPTSLGRVVSELAGRGLPRHPRGRLHRATRGGTRRGRRTARRTGSRRCSGSTGRSRNAWARPRRRCPTVKRKGLPTGLKCELDDGEMVIKWGRNGEFLACSNYPKCTQHQGVQARRPGQYRAAGAPGARDRTDRRGLREMRQTDGAPALALRRIPRMLGLSRLRRHQAPQVGPGQHRRQVAPIARRATCWNGAAAAASCSSDARRYPKCKFASWDKVVAASLPAMRLGLSGREGDQARGRALAMPQ